MKTVRQFRQNTLSKIKDAVDLKGRYEVKVGGVAIAKASSIKDAKYIRKNLRRFFKRTLAKAPRLRVAKAS